MKKGSFFSGFYRLIRFPLGNLLILAAVATSTLGKPAQHEFDSLRAEANKNPSASAYYHVALIFEEQGRVDSALVYFQKSLSLCKGDVLESQVRIRFADLALNSGLLVLSQSLAYKALDIAVANSDSVMISECYNELGKFADETGSFERAVKYYKQSIQFDPSSLKPKNNLSFYYLNHNDPRKAIELSSEVLRAAEDTIQMTIAHNNIGDCYLRLRMYDSAYRHISRTLSLNQQIHDSTGIMFDASLMGRYYLAKGDYKKAKKYFLWSYALSKKFGDVGSSWTSSEYPQLYAGILQVYQRERKPDSVLWIKDEHIKFQQVQLDRQKYGESESRTAMIEAQYEYEKRELALKLEQAKREAAFENQEATQRVWIYLSLLGLVFVSVVAIILYRSNRAQRKANMEIKRQKDELQKLDVFKSRTLSIVTHDIRSPLHSLGSILQLFQIKGMTNEELDEMVLLVKSKVSVVTGFVDDLLLWARDQMVKPHAKPSNFQISDVIAETVGLLKPQAEQKAIHLNWECPEGTLVYADREMIKIVVRNFITNAIKFCRKNDSIDVKVEKIGNSVKLAVRDTGVGMTPAQVQGLFNGVQTSTTGTHNEGGTGLGMMLCRDYIQLNGGKIGVESEVGKGSVFWFRLPGGK